MSVSRAKRSWSVNGRGIGYRRAGHPQGIHVRDGYGYVHGGRIGTQVIDVRDPGRLRLVGSDPSRFSCTPSGGVTALSSSGRSLYCVTAQGNLAISDLGDPRRPRWVADIAAGEQWMTTWAALAVSDARAYIRTEYELSILDLSGAEPHAAPGSLNLPADARKVRVRDGSAYVLSETVLSASSGRSTCRRPMASGPSDRIAATLSAARCRSWTSPATTRSSSAAISRWST